MIDAPGDHSAFALAVRRMIRAAARRVGAGDPADLAELVAIRDAADAALRAAVSLQASNGYSWEQIAAGLRCSRQAAHHRYADDDASELLASIALDLYRTPE